jgi:hypothetical protein
MVTSLCHRFSFWLRLRLIDASIPKLGWPLGEASPALGSFFGWRSGIDNLFDRLRGEFPSAQPPAGLADRPRRRLDL